MSSMTQHMQPDTGGPDIRLPDHRRQIRESPAPVRAVGATVGASGVAVVATAYLVAAPFVAMWTGFVRIVTEVHENAVRPRQFVGVRHGLPLLDPPVPAAVRSTENTDAEE